MNFEKIWEELEKLNPKFFIDSSKEEWQEVKEMHFPKDFVKMYAKRNLKKTLKAGKFQFFPMAQLIDENIWTDLGDLLNSKGFFIVGSAPKGGLYCLNMKEENGIGMYDLHILDRNFEDDDESIDFKEVKKHMKYLTNNLEHFMAKEIESSKKPKPPK